MIVALLCRCHGAEPLARQFFKSNHIPNWLDIPIYQGKIDCQNFLKSLPDLSGGPDTISSLQSFLTRAGSYVVIVGHDDEHFMWSNIKTSSVKAIADAELIVEQFA